MVKEGNNTTYTSAPVLKINLRHLLFCVAVAAAVLLFCVSPAMAAIQPQGEGSYLLDGDTTLNGDWIPEGEYVTLDLNGHTLYGEYNILVKKGVHLTIIDSSPNPQGTVAVSIIINGGPDEATRGGLTLAYGSTISGKIEVETGYVTLSDGIIHDVLMRGGEIYLSGGTIQKIDVEDGAVRQYGGTIDNLEMSGGEWYLDGGEVTGIVTISGGSFQQNGGSFGSASTLNLYGGAAQIAAGYLSGTINISHPAVLMWIGGYLHNDEYSIDGTMNLYGGSLYFGSGDNGPDGWAVTVHEDSIAGGDPITENENFKDKLFPLLLKEGAYLIVEEVEGGWNEWTYYAYQSKVAVEDHDVPTMENPRRITADPISNAESYIGKWNNDYGGYTGIFAADDSTYKVVASEANSMGKAHLYLALANDDTKPSAPEDCGCGGEHLDADGNAIKDWAKISYLSEITDEGNYYLNPRAPVSDPVIISSTVNLCLNGGTIQGNNDIGATASMSIGSGGILNIYDKSDNSGSFKQSSINCGGGEIHMYGGSFSGNVEVTIDGGEFYLHNCKEFTLDAENEYSATISLLNGGKLHINKDNVVSRTFLNIDNTDSKIYVSVPSTDLASYTIIKNHNEDTIQSYIDDGYFVLENPSYSFRVEEDLTNEYYPYTLYAVKQEPQYTLTIPSSISIDPTSRTGNIDVTIGNLALGKSVTVTVTDSEDPFQTGFYLIYEAGDDQIHYTLSGVTPISEGGVEFTITGDGNPSVTQSITATLDPSDPPHYAGTYTDTLTFTIETTTTGAES